MLRTAVLLLAALTAAAPARAGAQTSADVPQPHRTATMADTMPFGNRFGFPFSRDEYKRALRQILPEEKAEFLVRLIYEPDPEAIGVGVSDLDLMLLAALSDELGERVSAYRPKLRETVKWVRAHPAAFISGFPAPPTQ